MGYTISSIFVGLSERRLALEMAGVPCLSLLRAEPQKHTKTQTEI